MNKSKTISVRVTEEQYDNLHKLGLSSEGLSKAIRKLFDNGSIAAQIDNTVKHPETKEVTDDSNAVMHDSKTILQNNDDKDLLITKKDNIMAKTNENLPENNNSDSGILKLYRKKTMELSMLKNEYPDSPDIPILDNEISDIFNELQEAEIHETLNHRRKQDIVRNRIKMEELEEQVQAKDLKIVELTERIKDILSNITVKPKNKEVVNNDNPETKPEVKEPSSEVKEPDSKPIEPEKTEQEKENELKQAKTNRNIEFLKAKAKAKQQVTYDELRQIEIEPTGSNMEYEGINLTKVWMMGSYEVKPIPEEKPAEEKPEAEKKTEEEEKKPFLAGMFNDL